MSSFHNLVSLCNRVRSFPCYFLWFVWLMGCMEGEQIFMRIIRFQYSIKQNFDFFDFHDYSRGCVVYNFQKGNVLFQSHRTSTSELARIWRPRTQSFGVTLEFGKQSDKDTTMFIFSFWRKNSVPYWDFVTSSVSFTF